MRPRRLIVAAIGYVAFALIALSEIERLLALARPQREGMPPGFSPDILTRPNIGSFPDVLWSAQDVEAAFGVLNGTDGELVGSLIGWYLAIDLVLAIAIAFLLGASLHRAGRSLNPAIAYGAFDLIETCASLLLLKLGMLATPWALNVVGLFSAAKWGALIAALTLLLLTWWSRHSSARIRAAREPAHSAALYGDSADTPRESATATARSAQPIPWARVLPQFLVVGLFLILMAVPGPNAMTQLPDVVRASLENAAGDGSNAAQVAFGVAPFFLVGTIVVAIRRATASPRAGLIIPKGLAWWWPTLVGLVAAMIVFFGLLATSGEPRPAAWAWLWVAAGVMVLGLVARWLAQVPSPIEPDSVREFPPHVRRWLAVGLAGAVLAGASLAVVRAALSPALLGVSVDVPYAFLVVVGMLGAVGGPLLVELLATLAGRIKAQRRMLWFVLELSVASVLLVASLKLMLDPIGSAPLIGTTGVIAAAFGAAAVGASWLTALSLRSPSSEALRQLRVSHGRPSWLVYLFAVWLVSSMLSGPAGYHDATTTASGTKNVLRATLGTAIERWLAAHAGATPTCASASRTYRTVVPLVLVAAPGGGIRAAYWTTGALDALFTTPDGARCPESLFAVASASGGSVGATVRLLTHPAVPALPAVRAMAQDRALAANVAAMLYRDLPQSLFPARDLWDDRAAVHESAWERDAPILEEKTASAIGGVWSAETPPGVLLGSSSINDGCRAFTSTWSAVVSGSGCTDREGEPAPLTASHDARAGMVTDGTERDLPAVTAALLSARFPWVSPTGAIHRSGTPDVLYLADGGIYENTALLGLLQVWDEISGQVADHNRKVEARPGKGALVEPWLVFLNNGFVADPPPPHTARPRELSAPIAGALQRIGQVALGDTALLQAAEQRFHGALPGSRVEATRTTRVVVLQPTDNDPGLTAPLGWVLAPSTQDTLDCELLEAFTSPEARSLLQRLSGPEASRAVVHITDAPDC